MANVAARPVKSRNAWQRVSPSLVPVLAVLTALLVTVPFMMITGGGGNIGRGLNIAFTGYSALIEGALGIAINNMMQPGDVDLVRSIAAEGELTNRDLRRLASDVTALVAADPELIERYAATIERYEGQLDAEQLEVLGDRLPVILEVGDETLRTIEPLILQLDELPSADVNRIARPVAEAGEITPEQRAELEALAPAAVDFDEGQLIDTLRLVNARGTGTLLILREQLAVLENLGLTPTDPDASDFAAIGALGIQPELGADVVSRLYDAEQRLVASGITDEASLSRQLNLVNNMYGEDVLTNPDVATALNTELQPFLDNNFVVYRPGIEPLLVNPGKTDSVGIIYNANNTPDDTSDDRPDTFYARLGNSAFLFIPGNLERTLVRTIPFVIAGLAVALGFKAGLFNIGAEGQLYMGGILAVWLGFAEPFASLPSIIHIPLVLIGGILGGALWGAIPGALKAYTGAHEVINTIMLNFIAINLTDWMIKTNGVLLDPVASTPRTPFVSESARLPSLHAVTPIWFIIAGLLVAGFGLYARREQLSANPRFALRPVINGILVTVGGLFLSWLTVRDALHLGLLIMVGAVWFTDWFLERTTPGFELRTVGANPNAARYAGMNVKWNIILAMAMSGGFAGLAGAIEISSVQLNMQPLFFSGLGFDAIAVALLARTNPRNMIPAGFLWAALATGQGLMQIRADVGVELVKIAQALIIMFIAADVIVRYLWRVPEASEHEKSASTFAKGWGG